ncbi:uncharacterized protein N0V89_004304 [Didymosphaeria variabile]|uniref:Uncharacterized protein n=1 Tax=Didymosphaeria variabile TaxID=1932322 RepID=A0A9W9CD44_9PLEO|nr:uncharacterized protein N0V89_004304 [Didymosphaeria variabile]KAJ4356273.1 hypothetical protein N0V89_004304 [Didymosphaeria variabile]
MSSPIRLVDYSDSDADMADAAFIEEPQMRPSSTDPPPNAPTGPKSTKATAFKTGFKNNPPWHFSGTPSPQTMHHHILYKKNERKYFSITLMQPPVTPWTPLSSRRNMETRLCFHTGSRIHVLDCGHTVAVQGNAEPCAANCKPPMARISSTGSTVPTAYASAINIHRSSTAETVKEHIQLLDDNGDPMAQEKFAAHVDVLCKVWDNQDQELRPQVDLISGNFSCTTCGTTAHRATNPAAPVLRAPYHCIVVGKDEHDIAIIHELGKGIQPQQSSQSSINFKTTKKPPPKRLGPANDSGHRRSRAIVGLKETPGETRKRKNDAWHSAMRRREKEGVMSKLREDNLMEELDAMGLKSW